MRPTATAILFAVAAQLLPERCAKHIAGNAGWAIDNGEPAEEVIRASVRALQTPRGGDPPEWPKCTDPECVVLELVASLAA